MLNPELKKDIDLEILKSEPMVQEFLTGDYFRETLDLVFKVNRLNEIQKESVELETILFILNLSNYENISEAIKIECSIETTNTVRQLSEDLEKYIFSKLRDKRKEVLETESGEAKVEIVSVKKLETVNSKNTENESVSVESTDAAGEVRNEIIDETLNTQDNFKLKNLLDTDMSPGIKDPRELVKNIITPENKNAVLSDMAREMSTNSKENMKEITEKIDTKLGDVYLERVDVADTVIKKEI